MAAYSTSSLLLSSAIVSTIHKPRMQLALVARVSTLHVYGFQFQTCCLIRKTISQEVDAETYEICWNTLRTTNVGELTPCPKFLKNFHL
jgi:hypothetical protein